MWSILLYILASLMCLYGLITLHAAWRYRFKHIGLDLGAVCWLAGAIGASTLERWWPLAAAFALAWIIRLLGGDPGYWLYRPKVNKQMKDIQDAASKVRVATFVRLKERYESKYGSQAPAIACAITNILFSDEFREGTPAKASLQTQKDAIEKELVALQDDKDLLTIVHITLSQEIGIRYAYGSTAEQIEETFNKLKKYGLLVHIEEVTKDKFVYLANEFFDNNRDN